MADTRHKRCRDCGRFVPKERWQVPIPEQEERQARSRYYRPVTYPLCWTCYLEYDPME